MSPSNIPSSNPMSSIGPTAQQFPTNNVYSNLPIYFPSMMPFTTPSYFPSTNLPSPSPSDITSSLPSLLPSHNPSHSPSKSTNLPSHFYPTIKPFKITSKMPSQRPTGSQAPEIFSSMIKYIIIIITSLVLTSGLVALIYYWWKFAKARRLELDASKIQNDRYKSYRVSNTVLNTFKKNRSNDSNDKSTDDTTAILAWDSISRRSPSTRTEAGFSQTYSVVNILDDEETDIRSKRSSL